MCVLYKMALMANDKIERLCFITKKEGVSAIIANNYCLASVKSNKKCLFWLKLLTNCHFCSLFRATYHWLHIALVFFCYFVFNFPLLFSSTILIYNCQSDHYESYTKFCGYYTCCFDYSKTAGAHYRVSRSTAQQCFSTVYKYIGCHFVIVR